jgi:hypothetical protein
LLALAIWYVNALLFKLDCNTVYVSLVGGYLPNKELRIDRVTLRRQVFLDAASPQNAGVIIEL